MCASWLTDVFSSGNGLTGYWCLCTSGDEPAQAGGQRDVGIDLGDNAEVALLDEFTRCGATGISRCTKKASLNPTSRSTRSKLICEERPAQRGTNGKAEKSNSVELEVQESKRILGKRMSFQGNWKSEVLEALKVTWLLVPQEECSGSEFRGTLATTITVVVGVCMG